MTYITIVTNDTTDVTIINYKVRYFEIQIMSYVF